MYLPILKVHFKKKKTAKDLSNNANAMFIVCFFFSDFLYKSICCGYSFELQVNAIQMGTHNICLYEEVDKNTLAVICRLWNSLTVRL